MIRIGRIVEVCGRVIPVLGASGRDVDAIDDGLLDLELFSPWAAQHLALVLRRIVVSPGMCGSSATIACTAGDLGRVCVFNQRPSRMNPTEVAVTLAHEALHWRFLADGRLVTVGEPWVQPLETRLYAELAA